MNENIYLFIIGQGFINEALKRDLRELNVALTAVILIIVKTIPDVMKLLLYCKQIAGVVDAMVAALVFR